MAAKRQIVFLSHGGGPMPLLDDPGHEPMVKALRSLAGRLQKPSAILVISAHWEAPVPTLTSAASPALVYDYYGFAPEAYTITYPCPGEPSLSRTVSDLLRQSGIETRQDPGRGLDHGVFVPLRLMYPDAEIPCVQLSLVRGLRAC
ncbi:DODA-type extradiol aromatic ring-opening family dioxygenase [Gilvimarinus algae]|uniref:Class III extradiol ring-cleavage dioxygenase n=1 Tax=Gilvimarinus algae TaxID=3058037 RepID=A0ABT8TAK2_9GAMM|nr:class III extradiol ring-cleavage dioxygenase [Gilvimarinus sp. SDUM040014]MDO3381137.1 class III extradiol ring-cleavage dioxygenase [Gilvimarinus sp. SDUM040014]